MLCSFSLLPSVLGCARCSSADPGWRPLPARAGGYVQEGGQGRPVSVTLRETRRHRHQTIPAQCAGQGACKSTAIT